MPIFCLQIFDLFDVKQKGVIDFGDFVRSLNVFHPNAPQEDKINCKITSYKSYPLFFHRLSRNKIVLISFLFGSALKFHLSYMIWMELDILNDKR